MEACTESSRQNCSKSILQQKLTRVKGKEAAQAGSRTSTLAADALILLTSCPARYKSSVPHLMRQRLKGQWNWKWRSNNKIQGRSIISGAYLCRHCFEKKKERGKQKKRARGRPLPARVSPALPAQQQQCLECYPIGILKFISLEWEFLHLFSVD